VVWERWDPPGEPRQAIQKGWGGKGGGSNREKTHQTAVTRKTRKIILTTQAKDQDAGTGMTARKKARRRTVASLMQDKSRQKVTRQKVKRAQCHMGGTGETNSGLKDGWQNHGNSTRMKSRGAKHGGTTKQKLMVGQGYEDFHGMGGEAGCGTLKEKKPTDETGLEGENGRKEQKWKLVKGRQIRKKRREKKEKSRGGSRH